MPIPPLFDALDQAQRVVNGQPQIPPSIQGDGTRQNRIPAGRAGFKRRNMVRFFIPETGIVEMYVNPENITNNDSKEITRVRTKGGYVLQYWGEQLTEITLSGTTGSSGVEGINVLFDVYRSEQLAFEPFALALAADADATSNSDTIFGDLPVNPITGEQGITETFFDLVSSSIQSGTSEPTRPRPTLASLAFSLEMFWDGWIYRGFFTNFRLTESAQKIGLFDYQMTFVATQRRGFRDNFFPWHRSAVNGPSDNSADGVPLSYNALARGQASTSGNRPTPNPFTNINDTFNTTVGYVGDIGNAVGDTFGITNFTSIF